MTPRPADSRTATPRTLRRQAVKRARQIPGLDPVVARACTSRNGQKRALVLQLRGEGWRGRTYRKAKRFSQRLDRDARAASAARRAAMAQERAS